MIIQAKNPFSIVYANAAFSDLTGLSSETLIGKDIEKFLPAQNISDLLLTWEQSKDPHRILFDLSAGATPNGSHGNIYIQCEIEIILISPPPLYLMIIFGKISEKKQGAPFEAALDIFSDTDLVSFAGDEGSDIEALSLIG